jgi:hypothetical protein
MAGQFNDKARGRAGRFPPKRGSIKGQIFASMAASVRHALKRIGTTLAEIIHHSNAALFCKYLQPWKGHIHPLRDGFIAGTEAVIFSQRGKDFEYNHWLFSVIEFFAPVA